MQLSVSYNPHFNFEVNETLTLEKIIMATFANPDKRRFAECKAWGNKYRLWPDNINAETLIARIAHKAQNCLRKFNGAEIKLYDTSKLLDEDKNARWLLDLKKLRWYGPFNFREDEFWFQTATDSGNFQGLLVRILLHETKQIYLDFVGKNSYSCGSCYSFNNE